MAGPVSLEAGARVVDPRNRDQALVDAARQLEGVFISMMFEEMSKGTGGRDSLLPQGTGGEMYQQWFRGEVASQFARNGGMGLGDIIAAQLGARRQTAGMVDRGARAERAYATVGGGDGDRRRPPPVSGPVTSGFGPRTHPVTGHEHHHDGVDIAAPVGTPVRAPYGGTVTRVGRHPHLGLHVWVKHRGGYESLYAHLSETPVRVGQSVDAQSTLGLSGQSGRSTGPHLHFALFRHGEAVDPGRWIRLRSAD